MIRIEDPKGTWSEIKYADKKAMGEFWSGLRVDNNQKRD